MAQVHDIGRAYVSHMNYLTRKNMPLAEVGWTAETDEPWRIGTCLVLRVPLTKRGVVLGWWGPPGVETDTLAIAAGLREMDWKDFHEVVIKGDDAR